MGQDFVTTVAPSWVAGAVTTAGIYTIRRFEVWTQQNTTYFACFAAGVLIAVSFSAYRAKVLLHEPASSEYLFVIGFIDRTSRLGRHYEANRHESVFYRDAVFFSADEVDRLRLGDRLR